MPGQRDFEEKREDNMEETYQAPQHSVSDLLSPAGHWLSSLHWLLWSPLNLILTLLYSSLWGRLNHFQKPMTHQISLE